MVGTDSCLQLDDLSSVPGTHVSEGANQFLQIVL